MSTPPAGDEPTTLDQAKDDAKSIAAGAAKGAALGGLTGAVRGAGVALVKSKTGRNLAVTAVTVPLVTFSLIAGAALLPAGSATGTMAVGYEANSLAAAEKDAADPKTLRTIKDAAIKTGVRWEVLSAIWQTQKARTSDKGVGPFGIDLEKAGDGITKEDAGDLEKAAVYVGRQLASNEAGTVRTLSNPSLDAGAIDVRSNDGGAFTRKISTAADMQRAQEDVKTQYMAALSALPLKGMPDNAKTVYGTAQSWALGLTQKCTVGQGEVTLGGQTTVDLNESQLKYAQIIINRVAARKMPQKAATIALATALQESTLRMWWNVKVPGSEALTDDKSAKGSDGYSVGLFQQQVDGNRFSWGTVNDAMDPNRSTEMFLERLETISGWEDMAVSNAAQAVQASAFPDAYAKWEAQATQLVNDLKPTGGGGYKDAHEDSHAEKPSSGGSSGNLKVNTDTHTNTQAVEAAMIDKFSSGISAMYDTSGTQDHTVGRAVDLMVKDYKGAGGIAFGDSITTFLITNADAFGIDYLIWRDRIWLGSTTGWKDYSGGGYGGMYSGNWNDTTLHMDHVHVSVKEAPGTGGDYVYTPGQTSGAAANCAAGGVHGIGVGSAGENDDYPYRDPAGDCAWCAGSADPGPDPWSLYKRECVSFVAWRMNQQMGWKEGSEYPFTPGKLGIGLLGNAAEWKGNLAQAGYVTDKTPKAGAIAWWGAYGATGIGEAGHVAVVKKVNSDGTVDIEQYNAWPKEHAYSTQTIPAASVNGFIHVADTEK